MATGIKRKHGATFEHLWENPNPTASAGFAAQTINLDLSGYDAVMVVFRYSDTTTTRTSVIALVNDVRAQASFFGNFSAATGYIFYRNFAPSPTGVEFETAYRRGLNSSSADSGRATAVIPINIYGIKGIS